MEYKQLIKERYSVRKFSSEPVNEDALLAILEAARLAPTAVNNQPQRILVLRDAAGMKKLKACTPFTFDAPLAIVLCYHTDEAWLRPYDSDNSGRIDATIVGTHILLAVHDLGLGSTWVGHFDPAVLRREFNLPDHVEPVAVLPIGHPAPDAKPTRQHGQRRPLAETVVYDSF